MELSGYTFSVHFGLFRDTLSHKAETERLEVISAPRTSDGCSSVIPPAAILRQKFTDCPYMIRDPGLHRGRYSEAAVDPAEVVVREVQRQGRP